MNYGALETALWEWLSTATGLETRLSDQDAPQTDVDWCTVRVNLVQGDGTLPTQTRRLLPTPDPGAELEVTHSERLMVSVTVQAYTTAANGPTCAVEVLRKVRPTLVLEDVRRRFAETAGFAVLTRGDVRNLNALVGPRWHGRAALEFVGTVLDAVTETTTYIETTDVSVEQGG